MGAGARRRASEAFGGANVSEGFYERLFGVRGKVALVTGGTRGIGLMIAEGLVRAGARVYVSSRKLDTGQTIPCDGGATTIPQCSHGVDTCLATLAQSRPLNRHTARAWPGLRYQMKRTYQPSVIKRKRSG